MQPKPHKHHEYRAPPVTLYLEDIDAIEQAAIRHEFIVQFGDRDHQYRDLDELVKQRGAIVNDLEITFTRADGDQMVDDVTLWPLQGGIFLRSSRNDSATLLWHEIKGIIDRRIHFIYRLNDSSLRAVLTSGAFAPSLAVLTAVLVIWLTDSPWFGVGAAAFVALGLFWIGYVLDLR